MIAAIAAAALIHLTPPPAVQLAAAQRAATFHILVLPASVQLVRAEAARNGSEVRLDYSTEGAIVSVNERPALAGETPVPDVQSQLFNLDGYPATYDEFTGYRELSALTWYRSDLVVTLSSRDRVNAPLLIDIALELR